jgi:uncharacterized protein YjbJ (UPF0337 family)
LLQPERRATPKTLRLPRWESKVNKDHFEGAAQDVAGKIQQTAGMAVGDAAMRVRGMGRELGGKAQYAWGEARDIADDVTERAGALADAVQDKVQRSGELYGQVRSELAGGAKAWGRAVGRHPTSSLLLAGLAGLLVGLLVNGRR